MLETGLSGEGASIILCVCTNMLDCSRPSTSPCTFDTRLFWQFHTGNLHATDCLSSVDHFLYDSDIWNSDGQWNALPTLNDVLLDYALTARSCTGKLTYLITLTLGYSESYN